MYSLRLDPGVLLLTFAHTLLIEDLLKLQRVD